MQLHVGRLIDHVHLVVSDLEKSRAFYRAILTAIGRTLNNDDVHDFGSDELFVSQTNERSALSHIRSRWKQYRSRFPWAVRAFR